MKKQKQPTADMQPTAAEPAQEKPISKKRKVANTIVNWVLIIAILLAALATYVSYVATSGNGVPSVFGLRFFSVKTASMYPTLKPGDLIIDKGVKDTGALQVDDIITYWTVIEGERVLNTHRINEIYDGGGYLIFSTKGDNNAMEDPLTVHESEVVGKYSTRIPGLGKVFDYLQTSTGFLIVVVLPVFLFFLYYLVQFFRVLFEYQNVKNRIKFEEERDRQKEAQTEAQQQTATQAPPKTREQIEEEIREKLRAELLAEMAKAQAAPAEEKPVEEKPVEEKPPEEKPAEEAPAEQAPEQAQPAGEAEKQEAAE